MTTEVIVNNLIKAIENRDAISVGNLLAENISFENIPENSAVNGKKLVQEQFAGFFQKASSIKWEIERKLFVGNIAIIERKNKICFQGKDIVLPMVTVIEVNNNQITLFRDYFDSQTFVKQLND